MANMSQGIQLGGLGSVMPDPVGQVMQGANPLSGLGAVQSDVSNVTASLYDGAEDPLAMMRRGMLQAQGTMDSLSAKLPGAEQSAAEGRAALLSHLQQQYSPERESQLNWQALGNMGAAMMQPANDAQPGGQTQWSRGQQAFQAQRNENQKTLDKSGNELAVAQQALSDDEYKQKLEQYKLAQTDYKDNKAGIVDWQKAMKVAMGGTRWGTNVGPGGMWLIDKQATNSRDAAVLIDQNYFVKETAKGLDDIQKDATALADAFTQQAADLTAKGIPVTAEELRDQYVKGRTEALFSLIHQSGSITGTTGAMPQAAPAGAPPPQPMGAPGTTAEDQAAPEQVASLDATLPAGSQIVEGPKGATVKKGYRGLSDAERLAYSQAYKQGDMGAGQLLAYDDQMRAKAAMTAPSAPVVNTPRLEGAKKTATETATKTVEREWEKTPTYNSIQANLYNLKRLGDATKDVLNHPGLDQAVGAVTSKLPTMRNKTAGFESRLENLKSEVGFNVLQAMREASKTGGALGNISDKEVLYLQNNLAALQLAQSPDDFRKSAKKILDFIDKTTERSVKSFQRLYPGASVEIPVSGVSGNAAPPKVLPRFNSKGWELHRDANGLQAYMGPKGEIEEVQ